MDMSDITQQFCLRWNNYQSTLHHIFNKLWTNGTFVDVSLIVEGRRIQCHKVILSACSTYFEQLLSEHSSHPHPLLLLHDIPYSAVESLVNFMYKGEINVSHDQLTALLKVAEILKVKGLADSAAIANFTKYRLLATDLSKMANSQYGYHMQQASQPVYTNPTNTIPANKGFTYVRGGNSHSSKMVNGKRTEPCTKSPRPYKKRTRHEDTTASLPPSPPISLGENQNAEQARSSPHEAVHNLEIKVEPEEETDNELQIDESVGQSPSDSAESETHSNRNTPGPDIDSQEYDDRTETAQSLAALASQVTPLSLLQQRNQHASNRKQTITVKEEKNSGGGNKSAERSYTLQDLEEGIETVLRGHLTPAKAIAKYKVPRRTFFRRLSAVRKSRGIPSSKENAAEHFLCSSSALSSASHTGDTKNRQQLPIVIPGIVSSESSTFLQNITKVSKANSSANNKKEKKNQGVMNSSGNVFSLLNVAANTNYEYYLKYLKLQNTKDNSEGKRSPSLDGNRNLSSEVPEAALASVTQNKSK